MVERLLEIENLKKHFPLKKNLLGRGRGVIKALDGISFSLRESGSFGLVGESGSGKTTAARAVLRLIEPTDGKILWEGRNICRIPESELKRIRRNMQMIFQDPHSSLNPRKTVFRSIAEPLVIHERMSGRALRKRVRELLEIVGLKGEHMFRYPHELSGGQKQRVGISRALSLHPRLLILDEPTSALDVSVQAQMLGFLESLQKQFGLTYLFISHNLAVIRHTCETVGVMYLGKIVELGGAEEVFSAPSTPTHEPSLRRCPSRRPSSLKPRFSWRAIFLAPRIFLQDAVSTRDALKRSAPCAKRSSLLPIVSRTGLRSPVIFIATLIRKAESITSTGAWTRSRRPSDRNQPDHPFPDRKDVGFPLKTDILSLFSL
jgi:oligopeptide transport system ATP-binding protein